MKSSIVADKKTPSPTYLECLANRVAFFSNTQERTSLVPSEVATLLQMALTLVHFDIAEGEFVDLPGLGEFKRVENNGPMIRYQAAEDLLVNCHAAIQQQAIETLEAHDIASAGGS